MTEAPDRGRSGALKRAKRDLRRAVLAERDALDPGRRARAGAAVAERFLSLPEVEAAGTVMAFWSFGSEVSTAPLIEALAARGVIVALPRIVGAEIEARRYRPGDPTIETSFGAREPADGDPVDPPAIDVVATPAAVFDRAGGRVGYGGGFYDRFLPSARPDCLRVGLAFGLQVLPPGEAVPGASFDLPVDAIVTETEVIRVPLRRQGSGAGSST